MNYSVYIDQFGAFLLSVPDLAYFIYPLMVIPLFHCLNFDRKNSFTLPFLSLCVILLFVSFTSIHGTFLGLFASKIAYIILAIIFISTYLFIYSIYLFANESDNVDLMVNFSNKLENATVDEIKDYSCKEDEKLIKIGKKYIKKPKKFRKEVLTPVLTDSYKTHTVFAFTLDPSVAVEDYLKFYKKTFGKFIKTGFFENSEDYHDLVSLATHGADYKRKEEIREKLFILEEKLLFELDEKS